MFLNNLSNKYKKYYGLIKILNQKNLEEEIVQDVIEQLHRFLTNDLNNNSDSFLNYKNSSSNYKYRMFEQYAIYDGNKSISNTEDKKEFNRKKLINLINEIINYLKEVEQQSSKESWSHAKWGLFWHMFFEAGVWAAMFGFGFKFLHSLIDLIKLFIN